MWPWRRNAPRIQRDLVLRHDGWAWRLSGGGIELQGATLDELDLRLEKALEPEWRRRGRIRVRMVSDNEMIPEWMRPYMNHYFNRILDLPLKYRPTGGG